LQYTHAGIRQIMAFSGVPQCDVKNMGAVHGRRRSFVVNALVQTKCTLQLASHSRQERGMSDCMPDCAIQAFATEAPEPQPVHIIIIYQYIEKLRPLGTINTMIFLMLFLQG
jgi:hypothetical protein